METYPDVRKADINPLWHYLKFGWREGRNPSHSFETSFYLNRYDDVRKAGINPLVHYFLYGKKEERVTNHKLFKENSKNQLLERIQNSNIPKTRLSSIEQFKSQIVNNNLRHSSAKNKKRVTQEKSKAARDIITEIETVSVRKKISFISQPEYFNFTYKNALDDIYDVKEFGFNYSMTYEDFKDLLDFDADYNIFFRGEHMSNQVLKKLNGITINLSSEPFPREIDGHIEYTEDSLVRYHSFQNIRSKSFDYVFHYDPLSLDYMKNNGLNLSGEFVFPVSTEIYKPFDMDKKWDIFFIGRSTSHRELFFGSLKHYFNFLHIAHGIWGKELVKYISSSKICLNIHAEDEISWEPRLQMLLACGAFVISERLPPNEYLRPGIDFVEISSKDELNKKVSWYLNHENEQKKIASSGCSRVHEFLSSKVVFKKLIKDIELGNYQKFTIRKEDHGNRKPSR